MDQGHQAQAAAAQPTTLVYLGLSVDGYIAGKDNDLSWLPTPTASVTAKFDEVMASVGCLLMGRTTYDSVESFGPDMWMYGDTPVLVATTRKFSSSRSSVTSAEGPIEALIAQASALCAPGKKVYIDGGNIVQQALKARRVDELTLTLVPILIGGGVRLFQEQPDALPMHLDLVGSETLEGGLLQLRYLRKPSADEQGPSA